MSAFKGEKSVKNFRLSCSYKIIIFVWANVDKRAVGVYKMYFMNKNSNIDNRCSSALCYRIKFCSISAVMSEYYYEADVFNN